MTRSITHPRSRRATFALLLTIAAVGALPSRAVTQSRDTLRLADLQRAAVARDPRSAQSAMLREQASLRLANLRAERFPILGVNAQAQHQSDVTSVPFPGAVLPYKDTYDANAGLRVR